MKEGKTLSLISAKTDTYINDTNKTIKDDQYSWLGKAHKKLKMADREIIE